MWQTMEHPHLQVHSPGPIRVSIDGHYALSGGADGVVALHPLRRFPTAQPLWARQCHTGAVTCVRLHTALRLAISCGRDGTVVLHENVISDVNATSNNNSNTNASTAGTDANSGEHTVRVMCRVTGELRTVLFDSERRRVFIAGDSLRCLHMSPSGCVVQTIPMCVPSPVVSLALSPCGGVLAVASASCALGVVSVCSSSSNDSASSHFSRENSQESQERANRLKDLKIVLPNVLTPVAKREDEVAYRLTWCTTGNGALFLLVPRVTEARVLRFEEATTPPYTHRLRHVGNIDSLGLTDLLGVACHPLSVHVISVLLVSGAGTVVGKVDTRKWNIVRIRSQNYTGCADAEVDSTSGDVVVGTLDGRVTYMKREAPKAVGASTKGATEGEAKTNRVSESDCGGTKKKLKTEPSVRDRIRDVMNGDKAGQRNNREVRDGGGRNSSDDGFIVDDDDSGSSGGVKSVSSGSSVMALEEDFKQVVADLKRTNPTYDDEIDQKERPSRWRREDPRRVIRDVEDGDATGTPRRSVFLDDEAEESSDGNSDDDGREEEDEEGEDDNDGNHVSSTVRGHGRKKFNDGGDNDCDSEAVDVGSTSSSTHLPNDAAATHSGAAMGGSPVMDYFFQIGATPPGEEGSCYLAYNSVGYIHCTAEATTIHFHDMSLQAVRVLERGTMLMASLSPVGAAFVIAQEATDMESVDDLVPRLTIYYRTFVSIGLQPDWRLRLHTGEVVRCIATGVRYTAAATSRYLRIFSLSGLQLAVISLFPRIVAMVGTNSKKVMQGYGADFDPLAVCYLEGGGELRLQVLDVGSRSVVVPATTVPVTTTHQLQWMGWSEDGPLHIADTAGVLQMFTQNWGGSWVPVYDPRCMNDQTYNLWIWGVCDESMLVYRSCKDDPPYPAAVASGLPTERVSLFLPLLHSGTERDTVMWDHLIRREVRTDEIKRRSDFYTSNIAKHDMLHDKKIMEFFNKALGDQQTSRAVDLATFLELRDNIEVCAKEANAKGHAQLVQKLLALLEVRVKSRKKRRCSLPLEGSVVSERERDMLLRKMLMKEKSEMNNNNGSGDSTKVHSSLGATSNECGHDNAKGDGTNSSNPTAGSPDRSLNQVEDKPETANSSCATSSFPTRRRVTFADAPNSSPSPGRSLRASPGGAGAVSTKTPAVLGPSSASKATNPFSKRPTGGKAPTTASTAATAVQAPPQPKKPINPFNKSAKAATSSVDLSALQSRSLTQSPEKGAPPSTTMLVLGDSQSQDTFEAEGSEGRTKDLEMGRDVMGSPQQRLSSNASAVTPLLSPSLTTSAAASGTPKRGDGAGMQSPEAAAQGPGCNKGNVMHPQKGISTETVHPATQKDSTNGLYTAGGLATTTTVTRTQNNSVTTTHFVPKVEPFLSPQNAVSSSLPVTNEVADPFLDVNDGGPVSLDSLLLDVGHDSSATFTPRSASFGAALLKRYREEEEDNSNGSVGFVVETKLSAAAAGNDIDGSGSGGSHDNVGV